MRGRRPTLDSRTASISQSKAESMMSLSDLSHDELAAMHEEQSRAYEELLTKGLKLDLTRGKPSSAQLDLSNELLTLPGRNGFMAGAVDTRNYGELQGLFEL